MTISTTLAWLLVAFTTYVALDETLYAMKLRNALDQTQLACVARARAARSRREQRDIAIQRRVNQEQARKEFLEGGADERRGKHAGETNE
jgi:hypothetical protein